MIKYGVSKDSNRLVHINDAIRGLACNCKCLECGRDLVANQGNTNEWYFDHYCPSLCKGGPESAIHRLAKEIILKHTTILSPHGIVDYEIAEAEIDLEYLCPDIKLTSDNESIFVEIFYRNKKKEKQINLFIAHKLKSFEIDISNVPLDITPEDLEFIILEDPSNRKILYWDIIRVEQNSLLEAQEESIFLKAMRFIKSSPLLVIGIITLMVFVYKILFSRKRLFKRSLI